MHHRSAPPLSRRAATYLVRLALAVLLWPSPARADEPMPESVMVDRLADGDLDAFDTVDPLRRGETRGRYRGLSLSLGAHAALGPERAEHGAFVVVGIPLDAALPAPRPLPDLRGIYTDSPPVERAVLRAQGVGTNEAPTSGPRPPGAPYVRAIVAAAERAQGVSSGFGRLDALAGRARTSGLLPELRLRATRYVDDRAQVDALADQSRLTDTSSKNLGLEARLTFRLDRVVFADEEPALERTRLEVAAYRAKVSQKALDLLFRHYRARVLASDGGPDHDEAIAREAELAAALDALTGGYFAAHPPP
jgi:hypothetical protein